MNNMANNDYTSRYSKYGYGIDVRQTYTHLPAQWFWTWLTGKDHRDLEPRKPKETLLSPLQLCLQILYSWSMIAIFIYLGYWSLSQEPLVMVPCLLLSWIMVTNRTRGLLHTFHYTSHGAAIANKPLAQFLAKWFMSIPILHLSWDNYVQIHARDHHGLNTLCTDDDPDENFVTDHGFYPGMPEWRYWATLILAPFHPKNIWAHIWFRVRQNFYDANIDEIFSRVCFWGFALSAVSILEIWKEFAILYLIPLFLVTQYSSWLQHTTEHLWFAKKPDGVSPLVYYGSLTWGRFQGRPFPHGKSVFHKLVWWLSIFLIDVPIKVFSFMQDLPSHDFHHRSPLVNFWSIARERRANEGKKSRFGPMAETWGLIESWKVIRDHVCYWESDPFGLWEWSIQKNKSGELVQ